MPIDYMRGLFLIVNVIISVYILIYAFLFLKRTTKYIERRPWDLLVAGAFFFLFSQVLGVFGVYGLGSIFGVSIMTFRVILEFVYGGLVLMAFITQSQLMLSEDVVVLLKRLKNKRKQKALKKDIDKEIKGVSKKFYK